MSSVEENQNNDLPVEEQPQEPIDLDDFKKCEELIPVYEEKMLEIKRSFYLAVVRRKNLLEEKESVITLLPAREHFLDTFEERVSSNTATCKALLANITSVINVLNVPENFVTEQQQLQLLFLRSIYEYLEVTSYQTEFSCLNIQDLLEENIILQKEKLEFLKRELELTNERINQLKEEYPKVKAEKKSMQLKYDKYKLSLKDNEDKGDEEHQENPAPEMDLDDNK